MATATKYAFVTLSFALLGWSFSHRAALAQSGMVEGQVVEAETGAPISAVNVVVHFEGGQGPGAEQTSLRRGSSADAEGRFRIEGLRPGLYEVQATAVGYVGARQLVQLSVGEAQHLVFRLETQAYELSEIVVREARRRAVSTTTVQRLSNVELERQDPATVADVARLLPAAHVQTNSRGQTLVYFRGAADRQTAQFFNGALLNVPWDNRVDLGVLPAAMLGGVTVSKGVPSVVYGTNVVGGAVNFRSRTLDRPGQLTKVTAAAGRPGAGRGSILHLGRSGAFSYTAEVGIAAHGDFALPEGADLAYSQPGEARRVNTDRRLTNAFFQGAYQLDGGARVSAALFHVDAEKGIAPESHVDPAGGGVRYWRYPTLRQTMLIVNGAVPLGGGARLRGAVWGSRFAQDIYQYRSVAYERLGQTQADLDYTGGLRLIFERPVGPGALDVAFNALTTRHHQTIVGYTNNTAGPDSTSAYRQHLYSLGAEYGLPLNERLEVSIGASFDGSAIVDTGPWEEEGYATYTTSAIGLTAGLTYDVTERLMLRAAAGRKARFPTMRELYGGALGKFVPNPDLRPVTAYLGEVGAEWRSTFFRGAVTAFLTRTYDAIDKTTLQRGPNAGKEQRINLDGSRVWGVEGVAALAPTERLTLDGHLTWMRPRGFLEGEVQQLDEKPAWLGALTATYDLPLGFELLAQAEYLGGVYTRTDANTFVTLPDALIFDVRLSYTFHPPLASVKAGEVFARADNLTDEVRLLQLGLPGPGREFLLGLELTF